MLTKLWSLLRGRWERGEEIQGSVVEGSVGTKQPSSPFSSFSNLSRPLGLKGALHRCLFNQLRGLDQVSVRWCVGYLTWGSALRVLLQTYNWFLRGDLLLLVAD